MEGLKFARLKRIGEGLGLSDATIGQLDEMLNDSMGLPLPAQQELVSEIPAEPVTQLPTEQSAPASVVSETEEDLLSTPEQLELRIRQLVEADARFDQLREPLFRLFKLKTTAEIAARIFELSYLHGDTVWVEETFERLLRHGKAFYPKVHDAVRANVVAALWMEGKGRSLAQFLLTVRDSEMLTDIERLFLFQTLMRHNDANVPFMYFRRYRRSLLQAVGELGNYYGINATRFLLNIGKMAVDLGYGDEARKLLSYIDPQSADYNEALAILLKVNVVKDPIGNSYYASRLVAEKDAGSRVLILEELIGTTRQLGGIRDINRPALNEILADPLVYFDPDADSWSDLSRLLAANTSLVDLLPNISKIFSMNALKFHAPLLDAAIWSGPLEVDRMESTPRYWRAVGLLHRFIWLGSGGHEELLWAARAEIRQLESEKKFPIPYDWSAIHSAARSHVAKSPHILEQDRAMLLQQLRMAAPEDRIAITDIEEYIQSAVKTPPDVLSSLEAIAREKNAPRLEAAILLKSGQLRSLTNDHLDRIWTIANKLQDQDLAWRVGTVLRSRSAMIQGARHAWSISGEQRSFYPLLPISRQAVEAAVADFPNDAKRLIHCTLAVSTKLPELLAIVDERVIVQKGRTLKGDNEESQIAQHLNKLSWLSIPKKRYVYRYDDLGGGKLPPFMQVIPPNQWSTLVVLISEAMGMESWNWRMSYLRDEISDLIPRLASRQEMKRHSNKVAKWLRHLSPEQRMAWQDLASLSKTIPDQLAIEVYARFILRIATVMYQNHYMALESARTMRVSLPVLRDLEHWILSPAYSAMREGLRTESNVIVPSTLSRMKKLSV